MFSDSLVAFANSAPNTPPFHHSNPQFIFTNELSVAHDGWAQLAPFGDFPGRAMVRNTDGSISQFPAIQRLDRAAAEAMVARFKSPWHRVKRYFTGCHIYIGHPDVPAFANDYPDASPKGMIVDLQVRADGLFGKPIFTGEGSALVETRKYRAFSPYWSAREIGEQAGPSGERIKIFRPEHLNSAGLTNKPNLPVQLLNEKAEVSREGHEGFAKSAKAGTACTHSGRAPAPSPSSRSSRDTISVPSINHQPIPTIHESMIKQLLLDFLATQGVTLANEAADEHIAAALHQFGERLAIAETTLAGRGVELESIRAELANERQFHTDSLLDAAIVAGRITAAQRPDWATRLQGDFANAAVALAQLPPALKTAALTLNLGARKAEIANAGDRRDALDTLVRAEMATNGGDYDRAFTTVQKANPALFQAMKQPETN